MVQKDDGKEHNTWQQLTDAEEIPDTWNDDRAGGKGHYVPAPMDAFKSIRKENQQR